MAARLGTENFGFLGFEFRLAEDPLVLEGSQLLECVEVLGSEPGGGRLGRSWPPPVLALRRAMADLLLSGAMYLSSCRWATRPLTAVAVPTTTAVRAISRPMGRRIMMSLLPYPAAAAVAAVSSAMASSTMSRGTRAPSMTTPSALRMASASSIAQVSSQIIKAAEELGSSAAAA